MANNNKKIIRIGALLFWMSFIFYMSHQNGDESTSQSNFVADLFQKLGINIGENYQGILTFIIRKVAHLSEYFILAILIYAVFILYMDIKRVKIYSIAAVFIYASTDEIHQLFVVGRSGTLRDVLIDTLGGIIAILTIKLIEYIKINKIKA